MKKINKKSFLALGLMLGLGALSVAYAALSTTLTIESGTSTDPGVSTNSLVTFVEGESVILGGKKEATPINTCYSNTAGSAEPGEVTISANGLEATISGTAFSSEGSVAYVLCLENNYNGTVYLADDPTVVITNKNDGDDVSNIEVKLSYTESGADGGLEKGDELTAREKKILYVIIDVEEMPATSTSFSFTFSPTWTIEVPSA